MGRTWTKFLNLGLCKDGQKLEITPAVVIDTSELSCFDTAMICDWLKNLVPFLIESEVKPKACVTWS